MALLSSFFPASFDDLVFEGRNQAYGAYHLRQAYNHHMRSALAIMVSLCGLVLLSAAAWQRWHPLAVIERLVPVAPETVIPPTYVVQPPTPTAPAEPSLPRQIVAPTPHLVANVPTHVVKDELAVPKPSTTPEALEVPPGLATSGPTTAGYLEGGANADPGPAASGSGTDATSSPAVAGPYVVVEQMPEFAGGMDALARYLRGHLRYPGAALAAQAEGRVYVSFVVQADGSIADIDVQKGLGYGLDEEAQRVVRQMPAWTPGKQSHHAVPVRFTLPITFRIQ